MLSTQISYFDDAQQHARGLATWNQNYDQITPGVFKGVFAEVLLDDVSIAREQFNQRLVQTGQTPAKTLSVAIPMHLDGACSIRGYLLPCDSVLILYGSTEFSFHTPTNTDYLIVSIPESIFEDGRGTELGHHGNVRVVRLPSVTIHALRQATLATLSITGKGAGAGLANSGALSDALLNHVFSVLGSVCNSEPFNLTYATYSDIVRRSQRFTLEHGDSSTRTSDLCTALKVSRRTLHNSFMKVTGTSPLQYLKSIRLNSARRELSDEQSRSSVTEAAYRWGFFHLSHFSTDYAHQFGELPSCTRRRHAV